MVLRVVVVVVVMVCASISGKKGNARDSSRSGEMILTVFRVVVVVCVPISGKKWQCQHDSSRSGDTILMVVRYGSLAMIFSGVTVSTT